MLKKQVLVTLKKTGKIQITMENSDDSKSESHLDKTGKKSEKKNSKGLKRINGENSMKIISE